MLAQKQAAKSMRAENANATSKTKERKAKQEAVKGDDVPEYHDETPPGQKKSELNV